MATGSTAGHKKPPYTSADTTKPGTELPDTNLRLPPSPPDSKTTSEYSRSPSTDTLRERERSISSASSVSSNDGKNVQDLVPLPPPSNPPSQVLAQHANTPDNWVPRDERLIRLTGIHPFNVEAPLSALYDEGFLTTQELFYVRNHGAVPRVEEADVLDWEFEVSGLVENPFKITLRELMSDYDNVTYPITLVCAGNRRKEQNVVRKTKGFSWGAAGVSTALWTGVAIGDVLRRAKPLRRARYVCMEGADKLPNGYYGTNVKLNWAMDPNRGIMLAHGMNGEMLRPDHGKPLRVVVPGQIGGRSVKWLKKLIVTDTHSDNWYHIYDNRVLPTMVSPEQSANEPEWWTDERYAIYDLSTNSAIAYPAHDEKLTLINAPETYKVRGYAYGGGGRRVGRAEVTLDKGKTWRLANITYHEDAYRDPKVSDDAELYGGRLDVSWRESSFCWCFWDIELPLEEVKDCQDIMVRCMDESMNAQPRDMYWSVLGMMNNPWFRVVVHHEGDSLRFEHPTQPALMPGGWMERVKKEGGNLANGFWGESMGGDEEKVVVEEVKVIKMINDDVKRAITYEEFKEHDTDKEPWFVLDGEVYDGTPFLEGHPGGATSITGAAAQDATEEFMAIHSENAKAMMVKYHIGTLDEAARKKLVSGEAEIVSAEPREVFLQSKSWTKAILLEKKILSSDTRVFKFKLDFPEQKIGLPTGKHLMMRLRDPVTREAIIRSYTPMSEATALGQLDILIKVYFDTADRPGGKMTKALEAIPVGHFVDFKGPTGHFEYLKNGLCTIHGKERKIKRFIMICGGSGITPIFQVLRAVLKDREDETEVIVLDGNRLEEDILCRTEMEELMTGEGCADRCQILHTLSKASEAWTGLRGRVGKELLMKQVGAFVARDARFGELEQLVLICGPEQLEKSVHSILNSMGWGDEHLLFF